MQPIRLILVPVRNLASPSHRTIIKAARLARGLGADLELFHVIDVPVHVGGMAAGSGWIDEMQQQARTRGMQKLERIATRLRACGLRVGTAVTWDYPAAEAIVRRSAQIEADLIVSEQTPRHYIPSLLHAADWDLLRLSPVPVLLAHASNRPYRHPIILAAVDPSRAHGKPASLDEEILDVGGDVAEALEGSLHALHAYRALPVGAPLELLAESPVATDLEDSATAEAEQRLVQLMRGTGNPHTPCHLIGSPVKDAILGAVRSTGCSILVLGDVARRGLKGFVFGNTAERVLAGLPCDVLAVKPREFESGVWLTPRGPHIAADAPPFMG